MEIRSNTLSFGMAFIKPSPDKIENFANYIINTQAAKSAKYFARRGFRQLVNQQSKNNHFDISYADNNVIVVSPKSAKAKSLFEEKFFAEGAGKKAGYQS